MSKKLLILDDDPDILDVLREFFESDDLELLLENDGESALERIKRERPNVALIDVNLPNKSGIDVLREIKTIDPRICVIIMTGNMTTQNAIEAMKYGAYDYLTKPLDMNRLETVLNKAFQSSLLTREIRIIGSSASTPASEEEGADVMIGSCPEMTEIWKMVGMISDSDATVLIQ
jgi:DNA-binding NtrC family response regulator